MEEDSKHKSSDELFRSRFESAGIEPPAKAWDEIEKRLDEKNKRPAYIYWLSGVLLLLISAGTIAYFTQTVSSNGSETAAYSESENKTIEQKKMAALPEKTIEKVSTELAAPSSDLSTSAETKKLDSNFNQTKQNENTTTTSPVANQNEFKKQTLTVQPKVAVAKVNTASPLAKKEMAEPKTTITSENLEESTVIASNSSAKKELKKEQETKTINEPKATIVSPKNEETKNGNVIPTKDSLKVALVENKNISVEKEKPLENKVDQKSNEEQKQIKQDSIAEVSSKKVEQDSTVANADTVKTSVIAALPFVNKDSLKPTIAFSEYSKILSVYFSQDYYMNIIKDNTNQNVKDEKQSIRYTAGVKFSYVVLDKLTVRLGVAYSELKQNQEEHKITFDRYITQPFVFHSTLGDMAVDPDIMKDGFSPMAPPSITQFWTKYTYSQNVKFIHIPLELKYGFKFKRVSLSVIAGINTQYAFKQHAEIDLIKENFTNVITYDNLNINKFSFSGMLGLSADLKLNKRLSLFLEPHTRISFTPISKSPDVKSTPYFFGANAGLAIHF